jgi:uncharacterized YigZ family protein
VDSGWNSLTLPARDATSKNGIYFIRQDHSFQEPAIIPGSCFETVQSKGRQEMTTEEDFYYTIEKESQAEFRDRGSRFVACASPLKDLADFKIRLAAVKKEHSRATHHCFAYRIGLDGNQFRVSDDGEPSGSAGRPILGQIDSKRLTDVLVIVVRYFGGTLLGIPGLVNAYKSAAALALQVTPVVQRPVELPYYLGFDYTQVNDVMTILKKANCAVLEKDIQLFSNMKIAVPKNRIEEVLSGLKNLRDVDIRKIQ